MILKFNRVKNEVYILFSRSNKWRIKLKLFSCTYVYRMNLQRALRLKRVKDEGISDFEV